MALAEVKTLYPTNMRDMPAALRHLADEIEKGTEEYKDIRSIVFVARPGSHMPEPVMVFGIGEGNFWEHLGLLQAGVHYLAEQTK